MKNGQLVYFDVPEEIEYLDLNGCSIDEFEENFEKDVRTAYIYKYPRAIVINNKVRDKNNIQIEELDLNPDYIHIVAKSDLIDTLPEGAVSEIEFKNIKREKNLKDLLDESQ